MTEQRLRDLLVDLAADVPPPDDERIGAAWTEAQWRRRRGQVLAATGVAAALVIGSVGVAGSLSDGREPTPAERSPATSPSAVESTPPSGPRAPDASYDGVPVWWAPSATEEARLSWLGSVLPRSIDLSPGRSPVVPGEPALAVFTVHEAESARPLRFLVLTADGETRELAAGQLEAIRDEFGNTADLTPWNGGLSPDGQHAFFAQQSSLELYVFDSGTWITIDTADFVAEGARWLDPGTIWVPSRLGGASGTTYGVDGQVIAAGVRHIDPPLAVTEADEPYGIWVDSGEAVAGSYFLQGPVDGGPYTNPEAVVARKGDRRAVLALGINDRSKGCCPVVGWVGDSVVALESGDRVLAWDMVTGALSRVSELVGVDPETERTDTSWAWQALR